LALTFANVSHVVRNRSSLRWYASGLVIFNIVSLVIITTGYGANLNRMIEGRETFKEVMELCYLTRLSGDPRCVMTQFFYNGAPSGQPFIADLVAFLQEHDMYISEEPSITSYSSDLGHKVGVGLTSHILVIDPPQPVQ
jgi:hypothetical protein